MKEIDKFFKGFIFVQSGACFGHALAKYIDYINHPDVYAVQSAPWYTSSILMAIIVSITTITCFIVGHIIKRCKQK